MLDKPSVILVNSKYDQHITDLAAPMIVSDNCHLQNITTQIQKSLKWQKLRSSLDALLSAGISYLSEPTGQTPNNFPLFSYAGYSHAPLPKKVRIKQDEVQADDLAEFLHVYRKIGYSDSSKIEFEYYDREKAISLFSNVRSLTRVSEYFGNRQQWITLPEPKDNKTSGISALMTENHDAALALPDTGGVLGSQILRAKHLKHQAHPIESGRYIRVLIESVKKRIFEANRKEARYLNSVIISLKLDLAYIMDRAAAKEVMGAMSLARQIDDPVLIANCQRFATQCLDMTPEAIAMLEASCQTLSKYPEYSEESGHILPSYFGSISNRNTCMLTQPKSSFDPSSMEDDYWEAKSRLPTYQNMALLGNAAAVSYMVHRKFTDALRMLEMSINDNAEYTDRLNMYCNLLIAQKFCFGSYDKNLLNALVDQLTGYDRGGNWEYLKVRMCLNLMRITDCDDYSMVSNVCNHSFYWKNAPQNMTLDERFNYLLKSRFPYYFKDEVMKGGIGEFVQFHKVFPSIDKDYT